MVGDFSGDLDLVLGIGIENSGAAGLGAGVLGRGSFEPPGVLGAPYRIALFGGTSDKGDLGLRLSRPMAWVREEVL